jgi:hypothetical protein
MARRRRCRSRSGLSVCRSRGWLGLHLAQLGFELPDALLHSFEALDAFL